MKSLVRFLKKNSISLLTLIIVFLAFQWLYGAYGDLRYAQRIYVSREQSYDVIAFGDSLVEGIGARQLEGFVSILSERTGVPIYNAGIRRDTTTLALERLDEDVLSYNPKIVILVLGSNDFIRSTIPNEQVYKNLRMIIRRIRESGSEVLYGYVKTGIWRDDHREVVRALVEEEGAIFIPDILDEVLFHKSLLSDPLHPNDAGYKIVADRFEAPLRILLEKYNLLQSPVIE